MGLGSVAYCFQVTVTFTVTPGNILSILLEVGIPNFVCGYILRLQSLAYCFWVTGAYVYFKRHTFLKILGVYL